MSQWLTLFPRTQWDFPEKLNGEATLKIFFRGDQMMLFGAFWKKKLGVDAFIQRISIYCFVTFLGILSPVSAVIYDRFYAEFTRNIELVLPEPAALDFVGTIPPKKTYAN